MTSIPRCTQLSAASRACPVKNTEMLSHVLAGIRRTVRDELAPKFSSITDSLILSLEEVNSEHLRAVGAKAANIAIIKRELGLAVPEGFAVTSAAYERFVRETGLAGEIEAALAEIDPDSLDTLEATGQRIQSRIMETEVPDSIRRELVREYEELEREPFQGLWSRYAAVRSVKTAKPLSPDSIRQS